MACVSALGISLWYGSGIQPVQKTPATRTKHIPLQISGFTFTHLKHNRITHVLEAQRLTIQPRRFMVFNINSINEAILQDARMEVHFNEDAVKNSTFFDYQKALPLNKAPHGRHRHGSVVGMVTRLIVKKVRVDIFQEELRTIVLAAEDALVEKKSEAVFYNAILKDNRSDQIIRSRKILWNDKRKVFVIPGAYAMSASGNNTSGESIEIDLDFNITPAADKLGS